jgi:predicted NBD/HSP70 family sugar kinase
VRIAVTKGAKDENARRDNIEQFGGKAGDAVDLRREAGIVAGRGRPLVEISTRALTQGWADPTDVPLPRAGMLRDITDSSVMEQVFATRRVTRAGLSASTGISKPTISDAVRRLENAGILAETGLQTGRRGRVATFYELAPTAGWVLAVELSPDGLSSNSATLDGEVFDDSYRATPDGGSKLSAALRTILGHAQRVAHDRGPLLVLSLSVANAVDQRNNDIMPLTKSLFPLGMHNTAEIFDTLLGTHLMLDNDVNLAAFAERQAGVARDVENFAYFYLGSDLGLAFYVGDQVIRGAHNVVGAIGKLPVGSGSTTVMQSLIRQGFGRPDGAGLDVKTVRQLLDRASAGDPIAGERINGLCGSLVVPVAAVKAVLDPEIIVLGGQLGRHPYLRKQLTEAAESQLSLDVQLVPGMIEGSGALRGALKRAIIYGRWQLLHHRADAPAELTVG